MHGGAHINFGHFTPLIRLVNVLPLVRASIVLHVPVFVLIHICFQAAHEVDDAMAKEYVVQLATEIFQHFVAGVDDLLRLPWLVEIEIDLIAKILLARIHW